jgi:hypothetical protein
MSPVSSPRFLSLLASLLAGALLLAGCGKKAEQAKASPPPPPVAQAPEPEPEAEPAAEAAPEPGKTKIKTKAHNLEGLAAARADKAYMVVQYQDGRRAMFPLAELSAAELAQLTAFAAEHPLAHGKSSVVTAKVEVKQTKTIEKQAVVDGTETVQLIAPAKLRDQIGGTCMFYARTHYLDIAGYGIEDGEIYRVINTVSTEQPYLDYRYHVGMQMLFLKQKPVPLVHFPKPTLPPFEWARQELRKGRPVLAALSENVWLSLPADFLATHPFDGSGKIGHQVVINGFTYNPTTKKATFHIVNSWRVLAEFDIPVEPRDEQNILIEQSLSPRGEPPEQAVKVVAGAVTLVKAVGKQNLYSVETNLGPQKVVATSEEAAKQFAEMDTSARDAETVYGEYVIRVYDYIYWYADPKIRDKAAAQLLAEVFKVPATVAVPHVDFEAKSSDGKVYFVRVAPEKVVKLYGDSPADALAKAGKL